MDVQIVKRYSTTIPADDAHPYRTGAWQPNHVELDATDLEIIGDLPEDLDGVYLRNTENPLLDSLGRYHPFDGDGMLHAIRFGNGQAVSYRNRFVPTVGLAEEIDAGEPLWAGLIEPPTRSVKDGWGARTRMKDASSTDVVVHAGRALSSFYQCGDLYALDPVSLDAIGAEDWHDSFPSDWGVSAHTKVDEATGELLFFSYSTEAPYLRYGVVGPDRQLRNMIDVPLPGPRLPHDMAFTERFAVLNDCPLYWDPDLLDQGLYVPRFHPDEPTRFAIVPRLGSSADIRWFEAEPTYVLHWINAYEDGDEVVLDGFFQGQPEPSDLREEDRWRRQFRFLDTHRMETRPHRWRFNLSTGQTKEEDLSDTTMEFGMINGQVGGQQYRYSYTMTTEPGWFQFDGLVKHDVQTGREERYAFGPGVYGSETPMAPRPGATAEDDGYLVTFVSDVPNDRSECLVFSAASITDGPIARVRLPHRIASGTHAYWASGDALSPL
ncbi:MAG: carotenoid oxygenase family protein [Acidimicrobiales bacterium]